MTKSQKKALRFAYKLMRGDYKGQFLPFTSGHWIQPDSDPTRPFLDENVLSALMMHGYMECETFERGETIYLYRITPEGCAAVGMPWPLSLRLPRHTHPLFDSDNRRLPYPPRRMPATLGGRPIYSSMRRYTSQKMA